MMRKTLVSDLMNEWLNWGGFAMTRAQAYQDCINQGFAPKDATYLAFSRKAITAEEASMLIQDGPELLARMAAVQ